MSILGGELKKNSWNFGAICINYDQINLIVLVRMGVEKVSLLFSKYFI